MTRPDDIPQDVWAAADGWLDRSLPPAQGFSAEMGYQEAIARAILAERERWKPAAIYFERYCQDEADDAENCVCGEKQHEDAKAFAAAIREGSPK